MYLYKIKDNTLLSLYTHMGYEINQYYTLKDGKLILKKQSQDIIKEKEISKMKGSDIYLVKAENPSELDKMKSGRYMDERNLMSYINEAGLYENHFELYSLAAALRFNILKDNISDSEHKGFAFPADKLYMNKESTIAVVSSECRLFYVETKNAGFRLDGVLIGDNMEEAKNWLLKQGYKERSQYMQNGDMSDTLSEYELTLHTKMFGTLYILITGGDTVKTISISTNNV